MRLSTCLFFDQFSVDFISAKRWPAKNMSFPFPPAAVSKTTKELLLGWDRSDDKAVSVAEDLRYFFKKKLCKLQLVGKWELIFALFRRMPQFELKKIRPTKCHEANHMGERERKRMKKGLSPLPVCHAPEKRRRETRYAHRERGGEDNFSMIFFGHTLSQRDI